MRGFQCFKLAHQPVVIGVRNRGIVKDVVAVVRVFDLKTQFGDTGGGVGHLLYVP